MAENKSQAQHLASLDFDISQLIETLKQVDEQTKAYGLQAGKNFYGEFQRGVNETKSSSATTTPKIIDDKSIESATQQISQLNSEYGKLAKTVENYNASGKLVGGKNTFIDSSGIETVVKYNEKLETVGQTMTANYAKAEKAAQAQLQKEQALRDNFHKKNMTQIDAEIAERERQSKIFSAQIKEQMTLRVKEQNEAKNVVSQIERMIEKQKQFNTLVSQQRTSYTNKDILNKSNQYISGLEQLKNQVSSTGKVTEEQKAQLGEYGNKVKELSGYYQEAGTKGESFLQKISDKAKWLGAFYVVNELRVGFIQAITTIKETEDAVVSLQRVLNDESIGKSRMTEELYDIAVEYGRTFEEVAEVSQQFVQAGNDWTDAVELTRGTMLALNTAELDVTQSTEGLIAIMAQWGLEAEDYADVIDKINITADDFAVTSEKIVAALQRSSSSAKNANISLEETIGIITALAEATGRSGENIGTALNSLIIYTSKASALETFAEIGSDAMKQVVKDYQQGAVSIYKVWEQLSKEVSNLSAQQQSMLFESADFQELAATLETELKDVYGAAGTYRQNYFIALLNDMGRAKEAVENMADAEGYSVQENQKYMESLTAYFNQFKAVMAELAVQAGDSGMVLVFLKQLTQAGIGIGELVKSLGGIVPLLTAVGTAFVFINQQKISKNISELVFYLEYAKFNFGQFVSQVAAAPGVIGKARTAFSLMTNTIKTGTGAISAMIFAFNALSMIYSAVKTAQEVAIEKSISLSRKSTELANSLENLKAEYAEIVNYTGEAADKTKALEDFKKRLIAQYDLETEAVLRLNGARQDEINFIDEEIRKNATNAWVQIKDQYEKAVSEIENAQLELDLSELFIINTDSLDVISQYLDVQKSIDAFNSERITSIKFQTSNLYEQRDALASILASERISSSVAYTIGLEYDKINEKIQKWEETYAQGNEVAKNFFFSQSETLELMNKISDSATDSDAKKAYNDLIESVREQNFGLEAQEAIIAALQQLYPQFSDVVEETAENISSAFSVSQKTIDALSEKISELNDSVDDFQSGFDTAISAIEEYNENGYLTIDTIQSLISLGSEYYDVLNITKDGISLNNAEMQKLINARSENIQQVIKEQAALQVLTLVQGYLSGALYNSTVETENFGNEALNTEDKIASLTQEVLNGTLTMAAYGNTIREILDPGSGEGLNRFNQLYDDISSVLSFSQGLLDQIGKIGTTSSAWSNKAATAASNAAKAQTDALKKELEAQKQAIKDRYDAQIQALKDVQEENDRLQKQEEYYRNRQEALRDIEKAATRSGVEYREQEDEAREKLAELDREWQETVADWSIEDKIAELEALRDAEVAAIDAQIDALEGSVSSLGTSMVNTYSSANKTMLSNYQTEYLQPIEEETTKAYATVFDNMPELFGNALEVMLEQAKLNSMQLNNIYSVNFVNPLSSSLQKIQQQMIALQIATPNLPYLPYTNGAGYFSNQSVVNNNTRNANVFANVYNQNSANSLLTGIFRKP